MDERQEWLNRQRQRWQSQPSILPPSAGRPMTERCACGHLNETCTREPGWAALPPSAPRALRSCRHGIVPDQCEFCDSPGADKEEATRQAMRHTRTVSAPSGLDVERLAQAAAQHGIAVRDRDGAWDLDLEWAERVAAEYARLQEQDRD